MATTKSTNERFSKIEKRLQKIEKAVFTKPRVSKKQDKSSDGYDGLSGGIRLLIHNGFFKKPKELKEIFAELKRENYHYSKASISKILARDFVKKAKTLTRIKEGKYFKYVLRK